MFLIIIYNLPSNEHEPLLGSTWPSRGRRANSVSNKRTTTEPESSSALTIILIVVLIATNIFSAFIGARSARVNESNESSDRLRVRKQWEVEKKNHAIEVQGWEADQAARRATESREIERFRREQQRWDEKIEWYKDQGEDLARRQRQMDEEYRRKEQVWKSKIDRFEEEWNKMVDREVRERERARLYWDDVHGEEHCLSNGHRKYSARLANLTPSLDGMEACRATPITLNGVIYANPISCEDTSRGIRGHWVAGNENLCAAYWEEVKVKVCSSPSTLA
ncbi:hypothetical protein H0H92_003260 [Tricholoma furcatifolium]|nr:hypothetical protein H0H92_003260 [Tricholoma furcatifolium]